MLRFANAKQNTIVSHTHKHKAIFIVYFNQKRFTCDFIYSFHTLSRWPI